MAVQFLGQIGPFFSSCYKKANHNFQKGYTKLIASLWPFKESIRAPCCALVQQMSRQFIFPNWKRFGQGRCLPVVANSPLICSGYVKTILPSSLEGTWNSVDQ